MSELAKELRKLAKDMTEGDPKTAGMLIRAAKVVEGAAAEVAQPGTPSYVEIAGAVARGWCSPRNSHKEMDADLASSIAVEVDQLLRLGAPK